jgi:tetratricopeptide (TPR) repeat protein
VIRRWADALLREKKFDDVEKLFTETLALNAESPLERAALLKARGSFFADRGQWQKAAADLAQAIELNPDDAEACHWLAPVLVHTGRLDAYREHCRKSLEQFKKTTDPVVAERIAKDCLILPSSGADLETVAQMAEKAVSSDTNHSATLWFQLVKGLAEYRQGRFSSALEWAEKALTKAGERKDRDVEVCMVQAMAFHQLNQPDKALAALTKGRELGESKLAKLEGGDPVKEWVDWIIAQALIEEASTLIEGQPVTTNGAGR